MRPAPNVILGIGEPAHANAPGVGRLGTLLLTLIGALIVGCGSSLDEDRPAGAPATQDAAISAQADTNTSAERVIATSAKTALSTSKVVTPTFTPAPEENGEESEEEDAAEIGYTYRAHRVRSDGSGFERIADERSWIGDWSPAGDRILLDMGAYGSDSIHIANPDGSIVRTLEGTEGASDPTWSPDGEHIAWEAPAGYGRGIVVADSSGTGRHRISLPDGKPHTYRRPTWSLDGSRLAFVVSNGAGPDIYVANADGTQVTQLTKHPASDAGPTWSPGGDRIAFGSPRNGNGDIYVIDADGENLARLTDHPAQDGRPVWSPDGRRIAFISNRDSTHPDSRDIFVMDPDGSNTVNLTSNPGVDDFPAWSPDGSKIAFASYRGGGGRGIFVMNPDGSEPHLLTPDRTRDQTGPKWSPDGQWIYFSATERGVESAPAADAEGNGEEGLEDDARGASGSAPTASTLLEIICHPDGDTQLLTSEVAASADGVHYRIENQADEPVSMSGLELRTSLEAGETKEGVTAIPPGAHRIGCFPETQQAGGRTNRVLLTVVDPEGHWVSPELQCDDLSFVEIPRRVPGASGLRGDPEDLVFHKLSGLRDTDTIDRAGYPESNDLIVHAVRDGRTIATVEYQPAADGGWFIGKVSGCKGLVGLEVG